MTCLDENRALDFVQGQLDAHAVREVEAHIDACGECRALLSDLARELRASLPPGSLPSGSLAPGSLAPGSLAPASLRATGRAGLMETRSRLIETRTSPADSMPPPSPLASVPPIPPAITGQQEQDRRVWRAGGALVALVAFALGMGATSWSTYVLHGNTRSAQPGRTPVAPPPPPVPSSGPRPTVIHIAVSPQPPVTQPPVTQPPVTQPPEAVAPETVPLSPPASDGTFPENVVVEHYVPGRVAMPPMHELVEVEAFVEDAGVSGATGAP